MLKGIFDETGPMTQQVHFAAAGIHHVKEGHSVSWDVFCDSKFIFSPGLKFYPNSYFLHACG